MAEADLIRDLVFEINRVSAELKVSPATLSKAQFLKNCDKKFREWHLRKVGGFNGLVKIYFPQYDKDLKVIQLNKQRSAYVSKLEKTVGNMDAFHEKLTDELSKRVAEMHIEPKVLNEKETKEYIKSIAHPPSDLEDTATRSIVTLWSDQHFGTNVDGDELGGKNAFNWVIGARRLGMLCEQIATYKVERRSLHEELVILLMGDNIAGIIHGQEGPSIDLITSQVCGATGYYVQAINYLKNFFPKVRVVCQPGNHGRVMHKESKDRAMQQKYDSFENMIFHSLSLVFRSDPKVSVEASKSPSADVTVQGHRIFATHGDTVFDTGNVGKNVNLSSIENQIHKVNAEEINKGRKPFEMFCTGHVHHPVVTQVGPGIIVTINGCLVGTDAYAHSVGIHSSVPVQALWETTKKFVQGDVRQIYVNAADHNAKYEKIIKPYNYELTASKI